MMTPTRNQRRILFSSILVFTLFNVTLDYAVAEDGYKNDTNPLPDVYESTLTESGYKVNIAINPLIAGAYGRESGAGETFRLDVTIIPNGVGTALNENGFKVDLTPQKSFPELHNQKIEYVVLQKTRVGQGYNVTIEVVVSNQEFTLEISKLGIYAWNVTTITITEQNFALRSKTDSTIRYKWNTTGIPYNWYRIDIYAFPLSGETSTYDNTFHDGIVMVTIPGDVNGDRKVDAFDLYNIGKNWYPGYNTNVDINGDGAIDTIDLGIANVHYGQSW